MLLKNKILYLIFQKLISDLLHQRYKVAASFYLLI